MKTNNPLNHNKAKGLPGLSKRTTILEQLPQQNFDLIIVGGGIVGTSMAREATLAGKKVLLLEKNDFGHGTSSVTSKLLHGGLRYLKNLEFGLVRSSLRERSAWSVICPHLVKPRSLVMPFYGWGKRGPLYLLLGLILYQLLRIGTGKSLIKIKGFRLFSNKTIRRLFPFLKVKNQTGGAAYYDLAVRSPERLVVDMLLDATSRGAMALNYCQVNKALFADSVEEKNQSSNKQSSKQITGLEFTDTRTGLTYKCHATSVVTATGPWPLHKLFQNNKTSETKSSITSSSGIHLVIPGRLVEHGLAQPVDGDHIFLLPWGKNTLLGTTDLPYQGNPDDYQVTDTEINGLLEKAETVWPTLMPKLKSYYYTYGGIRPITATGGATADVYNSSRDHYIADQKDHNIQGLYIISGGKYTTSRLMAAECLQKINKNNSLPKWPKHKSIKIPLTNAMLPNETEAIVLDQKASGIFADQNIYQRLYTHYGRYANTILVIATRSPEHQITYLNGELTLAEVIYAFENEGACELDDVLLRRSNAGVRCAIDSNLHKKITDDLTKLYPKLELQTKKPALAHSTKSRD